MAKIPVFKMFRFQCPNINLQDFILLFGMVFILFTLTAQKVKAATGEKCDQSTPNCADPGEICSVDNICVCGPGHYERNGICENKITHGGTCNPNIEPSDIICEDTNTACITSVSGGYRCLCAADYYRNDHDSACNPLKELRISGIHVLHSQRLTNNVTLSWTPNSHGADVSYRIQSSPSGSPVSVLTRTTTATVPGLTAGTQYAFTITPYLPADDFYPEKLFDSTTISGIWTKPAKPGAVTSVQLVSVQPVTYDITFEVSQGQVSYYKMTVNSETGQTTGSATTFRFTSLERDQNYSYTATAYNGNDESSEPHIGTFDTPAIGLTVKEITHSGVTVTWKKPVMLNGDITGYTLTVTEGSTCVYGHIITCSDCPTHGTSGSITSCEKTGGESKTSAVLNDNTTTFTVEVSDLEPNHQYIIQVTADNTEGTGAGDITILFRTLAKGDISSATLMIVLGVTIPVIVIIFIIIIIIGIFLKRRKGKQRKSANFRLSNTMDSISNDAHMHHRVTGRAYIHKNPGGQVEATMGVSCANWQQRNNADSIELDDHHYTRYIHPSGVRPPPQTQQERDNVKYIEPDDHYYTRNIHPDSVDQPSQTQQQRDNAEYEQPDDYIREHNSISVGPPPQTQQQRDNAEYEQPDHYIREVKSSSVGQLTQAQPDGDTADYVEPDDHDYVSDVHLSGVGQPSEAHHQERDNAEYIESDNHYYTRCVHASSAGPPSQIQRKRNNAEYIIPDVQRRPPRPCRSAITSPSGKRQECTNPDDYYMYINDVQPRSFSYPLQAQQENQVNSGRRVESDLSMSSPC